MEKYKSILTARRKILHKHSPAWLKIAVLNNEQFNFYTSRDRDREEKRYRLKPKHKIKTDSNTDDEPRKHLQFL